MTAEQRACPACGTEFTWTPAAPRQKFCSTTCKHRWHTANRKPRRRARHDAARDDPRPDTPTASPSPRPSRTGPGTRAPGPGPASRAWASWALAS